MNYRSILVASAAVLLGTATYTLMYADEPNTANTATAPRADNSEMNAPENNASAVTADQAKNNKSDVEIMRQIRRSIVEDKSLSVYAHNVKVVAQQGQVTLNGTVHTEQEKSKIGEKAATVVGAERVTNKILIKGS